MKGAAFSKSTVMQKFFVFYFSYTRKGEKINYRIVEAQTAQCAAEKVRRHWTTGTTRKELSAVHDENGNAQIEY
jgi:hypothetical protein